MIGNLVYINTSRMKKDGKKIIKHEEIFSIISIWSTAF